MADRYQDRPFPADGFGRGGNQPADADPLAELERLESVSRKHWAVFRQFMPTRENPAGITDRATIDAGIAAALANQT